MTNKQPTPFSFVTKSIAVLIVSLSLISCGGGGDSGCKAGVGLLLSSGCSNNNDTNTAPIANPGNTQNVGTGASVILDGSASSDAEKSVLTYKWEVVSKPAGSTAVLVGGTTAKPSFTADVSGTYTFSLVVNDGKANSALVTVNVFASQNNALPTARIVASQNALVGSRVVLDGSSSSDANNDPLTFKWTLASKPVGSSASLTTTSGPTPSFIADIAGVYVASLVVNDGKSDSGSVAVSVIASSGNLAPIADAGVPQNVTVGTRVTLDGTASADPNNDFITYKWLLTSKPSDSTASLSSLTVAKPTFTADVAGVYVVALQVNDGKLDSLVVTNVVTASAANAKPVANAGPNQNVNLNSEVTLDGSRSTDADYDTLGYEWIMVAKPAGSSASLSSSSSPKPTFMADREGTYLFSLMVYDGKLYSALVTTTVNVTLANAAPVANAGANQNVVVGKSVTLDGTGSTDANKDMLNYSWVLVSKPSGSGANLSSTTDAKPNFVADKVGTYVISLIASDGKLSSALSVVSVNAEIENSAPVANAGPNQTAHISLFTNYALINLDGTASTDANGDTLTYKWSLTALPTGSKAVLSSTTSSKPSFNADLPGVYIASLVVNDGKIDSALSSVAIQVN
jgi:hypothetical protein